MTAGPLMVAGATGYGAWPANSLEGMARCLAAPVDGVEIDVQLTSDGCVIAHHDYRLSADHTRLDGAWLTEATQPLKTLSLEAVQRYDVGRTRPGAKGAGRYSRREELDGVAIPTLPALLDVMNAASGRRRLIYVEIKTDPQDHDVSAKPSELVDAVLADLEAGDYLEHAKIIAFDWAVLRLVKARRERVKTAHLTIPQALRAGVRLAADGRSPWADGFDPSDHQGSELRAIKAHGGGEWSPYYTEVTSETMAQANELGLLVGPWGLSSAADIAAMKTLGAFSLTVSGPDW